MTPPLFDLDLLDAIEGSVEEDFEATVWRQIVAGTDPLKTNSLGGRWNPPGVEVLYCSFSERGAELELAALLDRQPRPVKRGRFTHALSVRLASVARVTESEAFIAAGVHRDSILGDDVTLSQRIGAAAEWLGLRGLIVPSARHDDGNLVIIANRLVPPQDNYELVTG
jgi:RES domain-containing protein